MSLYTTVKHTHYQAKLYLKNLVTGNTFWLPVNRATVSYQLNNIPNARILVPRGKDVEQVIDGTWSDYTPTDEYTYKMRLKINVNNATWGAGVPGHSEGDTYWEDLFVGFISGINHSAGPSQLAIQAQGELAILKSQATEVHKSKKSNTWAGDPWFGSPIGIYNSVFSNEIVSGKEIGEAIIDGLISICNTQLDYTDWWSDADAEDTPPGMAKEVLQKCDLSIDGADHSELHNFSTGVKSDIARVIEKYLSLERANLFQILLKFCQDFNFALIPRIDDFSIVPFVIPGDTPVSGNGYVSPDYRFSFTESEIEQFNVTGNIKPSPTRGVILYNSKVKQGPWVSTVEEGYQAVYDLSYIYPSTVAGSTKFGDFITNEAPGWVDGTTSDGHWIVQQLARNYAIEQAFSKNGSQFSLPYIAGICPGSLIYINTKGGSVSLGDQEITGIAQGVQFNIQKTSKKGKVSTKIKLSHLMSEDMYDEVKIDTHPLCNGYFISENLGNGSLTRNFEGSTVTGY